VHTRIKNKINNVSLYDAGLSHWAKPAFLADEHCQRSMFYKEKTVDRRSIGTRNFLDNQVLKLSTAVVMPSLSP